MTGLSGMWDVGWTALEVLQVQLMKQAKDTILHTQQGHS
jgi:hypothetical protein